MAIQIPDLDAITGLSANDVLMIYRASTGTLKKIEADDLATALAGLIANGTITAPKLNFGGAGSGIWWEEIARTTLIATSDTITVSSIPARKYLLFKFKGLASGGTLDTTVRFNNDSGTTYVTHYATSLSGTPTAVVSQTSLPFESGATDSGGGVAGNIEVLLNETAYEKLFSWDSASQDATGGATQQASLDGKGKWANTSAQINRIDWINAGTGDFGIGSEIIVLGHN